MDDNNIFAQAFHNEIEHEIEAVDSLRKDVDSELDFQELFDQQLGKAGEWENADRKYRMRRYAKLQKVYALYVMAYGNPKRERLIDVKCNELKISKTRASHLSIRLVKLMLRTSDKTAYQYASALRFASLTGITCGALAEELAKRRHGIADLAKRFSKKYGTKQRSVDSSASGGRYKGPGDDIDGLDDDACNDNDNNNDDGHDHEDDAGFGDDY